jgi:mevalonate kinase
MTKALIPGKIILFGEHAVVYGRPAIAVPVWQVQCIVEIADLADAPHGQLYLEAPDIHLSAWLHEVDRRHPLRKITQLTLDELHLTSTPALKLTVESTIPVAAGLGSGAAVSVGVARALSTHLGAPLPLERQSDLAYEVEKIHHGTPSGIDNHVVTYGQPLYFIRDQLADRFQISSPFTIVIADTGHPSPTANAVGGVRSRWQADRSRFKTIFDTIGQITDQARAAIERGEVDELGPLMDHNHRLLEQIGVSSPDLERLIHTARQRGAIGAKLSGAGMGGNMIALASPEHAEDVAQSLAQAGASRTIITEVRS